VLASIPSPSFNELELGPLSLNAYGLMIALGVVAAVWIAERRWAGRGGDPEDIGAIAIWAVPAGLVGARLYHVATDWYRFEGRWLDVFAVWEGGLGIPGGLVAGAAAGVWVAHRRGLPVLQLLDVVAPAIPVAQAIGRLGNWFNQELFGGPTELPWALRIDRMHRPAGLIDEATYHPTFLYEALGNLGLAALLAFVVERRLRLRPGQLFALYVAGYAALRFLVESVRIDPATEILGWRVNLWVSAITFVAAAIVIAVRRRTDEETTSAEAVDDPEQQAPAST
jgi:prolipoprotein diacylglyceryl transferase